MSSDDSLGEVVHPPAEPHRLGDVAVAEMFDIEKQRIDRDNRRTAIFEKAIEMEDAENLRRFTYASQTRDAKLALQKDRLGFTRKVVWALLGLGSVAVLTMLGLLVFGGDAQRMAAAAVVKPLSIGVAGYGVIAGVRGAIGRVFGR